MQLSFGGQEAVRFLGASGLTLAAYGSTPFPDICMKFLEHSCPRCQGAVKFALLELTAQCSGCGSALEMKPDFLRTLTSKALFFSGALLLGSTISDMLTSLGFADQGVDRLVADLTIGAGYYFICRLVFSAFQRPEACLLQEQGKRSLP